MNRRDLVKMAGAMGVAGAAAVTHGAAAEMPPAAKSRSRSRFILVPGAFHGGWCYSRTAALLRDAGHQVWTPSLSGMAEHANTYSPAINLSTHIRDVVNLIDVEGIEDAVLCGHSYGGMVVAGVSDLRPHALRSVVYLDAFIPDHGQSLFDLDTPDAVAAHLGNAAANGGHTIPPIPAAVFGVNKADQAYVDSKCTPQPLASFCERIALSGNHRTVAKKMFIYAAGWEDVTPFRPAYEKAKRDPTFVTHALPCGHDVMIDMPDRLAELLAEAA